jgi:LPXTG-motif cell wall-anchored protein
MQTFPASLPGFYQAPSADTTSIVATLQPYLFSLANPSDLTASTQPSINPVPPPLLNMPASFGSPSGAASTLAPASTAPAATTVTGSSNTALYVGGAVVVGLIGTAVYFASKKKRRR